MAKPANEGLERKKIVVTMGYGKFDEKGKADMVKTETGKLTIATVEKIKELEETGYLDIKAETYDVFKEGEKVVKRVLADGREIKVGETKTKSTKKSKERA